MSWATLRTSVASAVADATLFQTFSFPPNAPIPNSVIVSWDDPMIELVNNQTSLSCYANLKLTFTVPALDNQGNLAGIESIIQSAITKLKTNLVGVTIRTVSAPQIFSLPSGDLMSADVSLQVITTFGS
jgi:hypothetical protein